MADVSINLGTEGSTISGSDIEIGNLAGRDHTASERESNHHEEINKLRQRVHELEQLVFGDSRLGLVGIQQQIRGQRFWAVANTVLTLILVIYAIIQIIIATQ